MTAQFFKTEAAFRAWLEKNHAKCSELVVGFYKKESGRPSITYPEARDQGLCFGWIDGIRRALDEDSYTIRFTPRKAKSIWSAVNIGRMKELTESGQIAPAGEKAFAGRTESHSSIYAYENKHIQLAPAYEKKFRANKKAWTFFSQEAPWYRRTSTYWVMSAKQEATQLKRLAELIADSECGLRVKQLRREHARGK